MSSEANRLVIYLKEEGEEEAAYLVEKLERENLEQFILIDKLKKENERLRNELGLQNKTDN